MTDSVSCQQSVSTSGSRTVTIDIDEANEKTQDMQKWSVNLNLEINNGVDNGVNNGVDNGVDNRVNLLVKFIKPTKKVAVSIDLLALRIFRVVDHIRSKEQICFVQDINDSNDTSYKQIVFDQTLAINSTKKHALKWILSQLIIQHDKMFLEYIYLDVCEILETVANMMIISYRDIIINVDAGDSHKNIIKMFKSEMDKKCYFLQTIFMISDTAVDSVLLFYDELSTMSPIEKINNICSLEYLTNYMKCLHKLKRLWLNICSYLFDIITAMIYNHDTAKYEIIYDDSFIIKHNKYHKSWIDVILSDNDDNLESVSESESCLSQDNNMYNEFIKNINVKIIDETKRACIKLNQDHTIDIVTELLVPDSVTPELLNLMIEFDDMSNKNLTVCVGELKTIHDIKSQINRIVKIIDREKEAKRDESDNNTNNNTKHNVKSNINTNSLSKHTLTGTATVLNIDSGYSHEPNILPWVFNNLINANKININIINVIIKYICEELHHCRFSIIYKLIDKKLTAINMSHEKKDIYMFQLWIHHILTH